MTIPHEEYQRGYNDGVAAGRAQLAMLLHQWQPLDHPNDESGYCRCDVCSVLYPIQARLINAFQARPPHDDCPRCEIMTRYLVVRNLCNDGLIGTGPFPGHTGLYGDYRRAIWHSTPIISRMLVY